jgi:hypothetical protein
MPDKCTNISSFLKLPNKIALELPLPSNSSDKFKSILVLVHCSSLSFGVCFKRSISIRLPGIADWIYDKDDIYINWYTDESSGEQFFQVVPNSAFETSLFPVEKGQTDKIRWYVYRGYMRFYEAKTRARAIDLIEIDTSTVPSDFDEYKYYYKNGEFIS